MNLNKWQLEVVDHEAQVLAVITPRRWGKSTVCQQRNAVHVVPTRMMVDFSAGSISYPTYIDQTLDSFPTAVAFDEFLMVPSFAAIKRTIATGSRVLLTASLIVNEYAWVVDWLKEAGATILVYDVFQMTHVPLDRAIMSRETMDDKEFEAQFMPHRALLRKLLP